MKILLILFFTFSLTLPAYAQNTFKAVVQDSITQEPLSGVTARVQETNIGAISRANGELTIENIPNGTQTIRFSYIGYAAVEQTYNFPLSDDKIIVFLTPEATETDEVVVEGTRTNKSISTSPTRVEVLTEEIDEASTMDPSKIAHLITHSTGIQVQQTSATSNTANVRIQGLDGRYTQILKDGFPLYGGFSGSLSIMQIPPLDLRQIEYIKGGASTLYGAGAISGLINLISKEPTSEETLIHLNASHIGAFDVNAFVSRQIGDIGFTLLGQRNAHAYFDADDDGFSDLPQLVKYNLNPKLFFTVSDATRLTVGGTFTEERRQGGDTRLMQNEYADSVNFYKEVNDINRITTQATLSHKLSSAHTITFKNSFNIFDRALRIVSSPLLQEYRFSGSQLSSFSEAAYTFQDRDMVIISGLNFYSDDFKEDSLQSPVLRDEDYKTIGGFVNYTSDFGNWLSLEAGFRGDYVFDEKFFALPRVSALFKWTDKLRTRIGGGMGYRNPTIFNQEAELFGYQNILPIDKSTTKAEESYGGNADISYNTPIGENFFININQMFFYTYLANPLILVPSPAFSQNWQFINADGYTQSAGAETFFKFGFYDFVFFAGYTYTNATNFFNGNETPVTLTPQHSLKGDLLYSLPGKWRIGVDYEFKSSQTLSTGRQTPSYWTYGAVVEHVWENYTFFGNVENVTNVRQTNFESLRSAPYSTPQFTEVWAPLDGFVFNAGIKVRL